MLNEMTQKLYDRSRNRGRWNQLRSRLSQHSTGLFNLTDIEATCPVEARRSAGTQTVSISQIQGTENRRAEFDRDFNPLRDHNEQRWQKIAALWLEGRGLPLIELVQVGQVYFVRDGHHRISVARALGQEDIEAQVTVWRFNGPLPWEPSEAKIEADRPKQWQSRLGRWLAAVGHRLKAQPQNDVPAASH